MVVGIGMMIGKEIGIEPEVDLYADRTRRPVPSGYPVHSPRAVVRVPVVGGADERRHQRLRVYRAGQNEEERDPYQD